MKSRMMTTRRKKTRDEMNWLKSGFFGRDVIMLVRVVDEWFQMDWEVFIDGIGIFGWLNFWLNIFRGIFLDPISVRLLFRCALLFLSYNHEVNYNDHVTIKYVQWSKNIHEYISKTSFTKWSWRNPSYFGQFCVMPIWRNWNVRNKIDLNVLI